jgi:hypothetical protein
MKQHPDCQPRRAISVQGGNQDDSNADQDFEDYWIDIVTIRELLGRLMLTKAPPALKMGAALIVTGRGESYLPFGSSRISRPSRLPSTSRISRRSV